MVKNVKWEITENLAQKFLREVPQYNAFYFFTSINNYSGTYARSLLVFLNKLKTIDETSIDFHFKRRDFEKWIRTTIGDNYLASEISKINKSLDEEELPEKVYQLVKKRLNDLKQFLANEETYIEHK